MTTTPSLPSIAPRSVTGAASPTSAPSWRHALAWFALFTAIGSLNALHFYLGQTDIPRPWLLKLVFVQELTGAWTACLLMPLVVRVARRLRVLPRPGWVACHVAALFVFSAAHTTLIWASRQVAVPLVGLGPSLYGWTFYRASMEFPSDIIVYTLFVCATWLVDHFRASRARELRASQLESALAEARLEALRLQLNPHFLFNALNAVSETMYDRPRVADEILARIGELLRATLAASAQEHALADELRLLGLYVSIQRARFGEQLQVDVDIAPGLEHVRVPFLVLQPLVENAIEHGGDAFGRRIAIRAVVGGERDELAVFHVRDQGGPGGTHTGHGIGLANLKARLAHLYGDAGGLALEPIADGGMNVRLWLPRGAGRAS